jgi:WD40 repeat protein
MKVSGLALSGNGQVLAVADYDQAKKADSAVTVWDVERRERRATFRADPGAVFGVALSPDGKTLAYGSGRTNILKIGDVVSGKELFQLTEHKLEPPYYINSVAFSPDGKILVSGSLDHMAILWDPATGKRLSALSRNKDDGIWFVNFLAVAFSPSGDLLASGHHGGEVRLWNVASRTHLTVLRPGGGRVFGVAFSPDGKTLAAANSERPGRPEVYLWDVAQVVASKDPALPPHSVLKHDSHVGRMAFTPDGQTLAAVDANKRVTLWDVASGQKLLLDCDLAGETDLTFAPDGKTLAVIDGNTVKLWYLANLPGAKG